jgi:hypothetical protein
LHDRAGTDPGQYGRQQHYDADGVEANHGTTRLGSSSTDFTRPAQRFESFSPAAKLRAPARTAAALPGVGLTADT